MPQVNLKLRAVQAGPPAPPPRETERRRGSPLRRRIERVLRRADSRRLLPRLAVRVPAVGRTAMSVLDESILNALRQLPAAAAPDEQPSVVFERAAAISAQLAVGAAFRERLHGSEAAALGCSADGRLSKVGRCLSNGLHVESYDRAESRLETVINATARLHAARLFFSFSADEASASARFTLRAQQQDAEGSAPPTVLLRVHAARGLAPRVSVRASALVALDRRAIGSGLDAVGLTHVLVGFLPEMLGSGEWYEECYGPLVDATMRRALRCRRRLNGEGERGGRRWLERSAWWRRRTAR